LMYIFHWQFDLACRIACDGIPDGRRYSDLSC